MWRGLLGHSWKGIVCCLRIKIVPFVEQTVSHKVECHLQEQCTIAVLEVFRDLCIFRTAKCCKEADLHLPLLCLATLAGCRQEHAVHPLQCWGQCVLKARALNRGAWVKEARNKIPVWLPVLSSVLEMNLPSVKSVSRWLTAAERDSQVFKD